MTRDRILALVEMGLAVALAAALNLFVLFEMPQGGSISLEMAPILLVALRRGWRAGVTTGVVYGLVNLAMKPYIVHPAQVILDYPLAYGLLGLGGLFAARWHRLLERHDLGAIVVGQWTAILPAAIVGAAARAVSHVISGAIFFASYAPKGQNPWVYSLIYNGTYLIPSAVLVAIVLWVVQPLLDRVVPIQGRSLGAA